MKGLFIDTIDTAEGIYVFRFSKSDKGDKYTVTQVNNALILPFTMAMAGPAEWKIEGGVKSELRALEMALSALIINNNLPAPTPPAADDVLKKIQAYTEVHLSAGEPKPEVRIDTLMLDLRMDKETLMELLISLQQLNRVVLKLNQFSAPGTRSSLSGTVSLVD